MATKSRALARLDKIAVKLHEFETGQFLSSVTLGKGALNPTEVAAVLKNEVEFLGRDADDFYVHVIASANRPRPCDITTYNALRTITLDHDLRLLERTHERLSGELEMIYLPREQMARASVA